MLLEYLKTATTLGPMLLGLILLASVHLEYSRTRGAEVAFESFVHDLDQEQYSIALREIDSAVSRDPRNAHYLAHEALLHERMLKKNFEAFRFHQPQFNEEEKQHKRFATDFYKQVLELNASDDGAYHNLGWLYWFLQQPQEAFRCVQKAIAIDGSVALYHISLGLFHEYRNEQRDAFNEYTLALRDSPAILDSQFFHDLERRSPSQAADVITSAILHFENELRATASPLIKGKLGKLYLYRDPERATTMLKEATTQLPGLSRPWFNLGYLHELGGDEEQARQCYERAAFIDSFDVLSWYRLGKFYDRHSRTPEAIRCYNQAVNNVLHPGSVHASRELRIYLSRFTVYDDVIPKGLLSYSSPGFDLAATCVRLAELYRQVGNLESAKYFEEVALKYASPAVAH